MWHPPLSSACLMFAAVCLDASPPPSHHLVLGCVPSLSACLGSCLFPLRPAIDVDAAAVPWLFVSPPAPPHRHDGRGDTTGLWRFSRLCLLAPRLAISSVRSASDGDGGVAYSALWPSSVPPATRSLAQSDFLVALYRPAVPSVSSPPSPITRHGGRGGGPWFWRLAFAVRFHLRSICVGSVYCGGGGCLACLGVVLCMLSMG